MFNFFLLLYIVHVIIVYLHRRGYGRRRFTEGGVHGIQTAPSPIYYIDVFILLSIWYK